ncbi:hypothetical protein PV396_44070 [Streptomyces sp. ME02-8801-2C]|uniref:hypothetical protein n=1 Tax=Streptomyces sp. ME02-8801-2C TaxID=3028680 RepID=UPI0029B77034|nr:hypothetical protein [Streptomyces sp. ME02-8801-2C]MDX3458823.1 hypothetical protein [Streptomyces sp. ME02-8801-2C]
MLKTSQNRSLNRSLRGLTRTTPLAFALALVGSVFLAPGQPAVADQTYGGCPDYRIMDYVTKSWKLTHLDVFGNHTGVKRKYSVTEETQTHLEAEVTLTATTSVKAQLKFLADARVETGIELRGLGSKTKKTSYTWSVTLPSGHKWVFYHGRRYVQGREYGYHCQSLVNHVKSYTAKGKSFSKVNYDDAYRCDKKPKDGLAKIAINKGC